jgi:FG-GAP repeat.
VSKASGIASVKGKSLGVAFNDYDGDGRPDIFVANDGMEQFLFRNRGDGTFEECALRAGVALQTMASHSPAWELPLRIMTTTAGPTFW